MEHKPMTGVRRTRRGTMVFVLFTLAVPAVGFHPPFGVVDTKATGLAGQGEKHKICRIDHRPKVLREGFTLGVHSEGGGGDDESFPGFEHGARRYLNREVVENAVGGSTSGAEEWTPDLCKKRTGVLQRKLRQIQTLRVQHTRDPTSLNDDQLAKIERKDDIKREIAELEILRRKLEKGTRSNAGVEKDG
ncbi:unnamed protein product, partial [Discosporangium mesarthrocarpum]